ncbi:hypothetical protein FD755_007120, partial [Muntiacus reevesi]
ADSLPLSRQGSPAPPPFLFFFLLLLTKVLGRYLSLNLAATYEGLLGCGIIYWLFGGAVRNLGGPAHVTQWLQPLQEQKYTGMFAMTERGHGSNVRGIQTEATFDFSAQEFVINTPCKDAEKMYIGNAMYGNYAAVFAQLIIHGRSQGPHCFIVPVRDEHGRLHPGVTVVDMMHKEGLHGVDNGILRFDNVRIPRENLLDKFGSVAPDGQYHSPIKDKSARFNAMLAALTPSRLAVTFQAMGSMKLHRELSAAFLPSLCIHMCAADYGGWSLGLTAAGGRGACLVLKTQVWSGPAGLSRTS